jgi:hypothetical protein
MIDEDDFWSNWRNENWQGKPEVVGENLPQRHFVHHKIPYDQTRARTPDHSGGKPATNRLSCGAASFACLRSAFHHFSCLFFFPAAIYFSRLFNYLLSEAVPFNLLFPIS